LMTPFGPISGIVQKDSLSKEKHGKYWMTPEEFEAFQRRRKFRNPPLGGTEALRIQTKFEMNTIETREDPRQKIEF